MSVANLMLKSQRSSLNTAAYPGMAGSAALFGYMPRTSAPLAPRGPGPWHMLETGAKWYDWLFGGSSNYPTRKLAQKFRNRSQIPQQYNHPQSQEEIPHGQFIIHFTSLLFRSF